MNQQSGILLVVSGPSGCGKTTLCRRLTDESHDQVSYSISCTTRRPRTGEVNGVDYHFLSLEDFQSRILTGDFLEWAEVHGNFYGTLKSEVTERLSKGLDVIMDIDVQGAASIRQCKDDAIQKAYVDLFINVPQEELRNRLGCRNTDSDEIIAVRLKNALEENEQCPLYQHCFDSSDRETDYSRFKSIVEQERAKRTSPLS